MRKPIIPSLVALALIGTNLNAESMYDKFQTIQAQMKQLQNQLADLKEKQKGYEDALEQTQEDAKASADDEEVDDEGDNEEDFDVKEEIADLQEVSSDLTRATAGNHLKFQVDYRFAIDNIDYKMADGSKQGNDALLTNRLWINTMWAATDHISFTGQLAYNKAYGARSGWGNDATNMETFDWITNENAYDDVLRVRSAYFFYRNDTFLGTEIPWTFSIGRRPSTNGHLVNMRDDDRAASPMGHTINVEFDGLSSKFSFDSLVEGMYIKFCMGRGGTNAEPRFYAVDQRTGQIEPSVAYATNKNDLPDIDLAGFIFVPYDNGQYSFGSQFYYANNLIDANIVQTPTVNSGAPTITGMKTVGGLYSVTGNFVARGIGDGISDFLDDTTFFISGAMSITNPKAGESMLGSSDPVRGYSAWVGVQFPSLISDWGRWGLEYNEGSSRWRSITYAEDTNIGSKLAARGKAYEAYFTENLIEDVLSMQLRYTYIDYKYTGSNGFFGSTTGSAQLISSLPAQQAAVTVDKAQDIRFYLRYRY